MLTALLVGTVALSAGAPGEAAAERTAIIVNQLVATLRDEPRGQPLWSRVQAARTLGKLGSEAKMAVPALASMLDDPSRRDPPLIDEAIINALARMGSAARPAIPALVRLSGKDSDIERAAVEAIDTILLSPPIGPGDVPALMRDIRDRDVSVRVRAVKALGMLGAAGKVALPLLVEALKDPDPDVRTLALKAIRKIAPEGTGNANEGTGEVSLYSSQLRDPDPSVRLQAAKALGRLGPAAAPAAQALLEATTDTDRDVRRQATDALNRVQPQ
jgi:HEAT repeat protein